MKKRVKNQNAEHSNSQSSKPFFNKSEEGTFFSKEVEPPFFPPSNIQAKLTIGQTNDKYEKEADAVANLVGRGETGLIRHSTHTLNLKTKCSDCSENENNVRRKSKEEELNDIQTKPLLTRKMQNGENTGATALTSQLNSGKGGKSLPEATNQDMSQFFGADFNHVRIHTDSRASEMNKQLNARAFTYGADIYFNEGQYNPSSSEGKKLLAHELTHTIQQGHVGQKVQKKQSCMQVTEGANTVGLSEEEKLLAQTVSQLNKPRVQRSTNWAAGNVHETINSAETVLTGAPNPITWPLLNGTKLVSVAAVTGAINSSTISISKSWKAKVTNVPLNEGSFDETVLSSGPWTKVVSKATVNGRFGIAACKGGGKTTFQSKGDPSDDAVFKANRRHEDHHASDHHAAFNDIIKTWDVKVTEAKNKGTEFGGTSAADAEANLWAAMGGTPSAIATDFLSECFARGGAFHATPGGGPMSISNPGSDKTCTNSWVNVTNPS